MFAVHPLGRPVSASIRPPGSKSQTNRALVAAALAHTGVSRLYGPLEAEDTAVMRQALRQFGVMIDDNDDPWLVLGSGGTLSVPENTIDVGASGTTARFITAVAALANGATVIDGTTRMRQRPIGPLQAALRSLGITVTSRDGFPPVEIVDGGSLRGGRVQVDAAVSSQFASALLLVAPMARERVEIELTGRVVSRPYLISTVEIMRQFGAEVRVDGNRFVVEPTGYTKAHVSIEADASAAVYPAVAAAITGGSVLIRGIPPGSSQADLEILEFLERMGCVVAREDEAIHVEGPAGGLASIEADLSGAPDGAMGLAAACLFADGPSRLSGLSTLRVKETDRLTALESELRKVGAEAVVEGDSLLIRPGALHGAEIDTYDDHRMAMSMALIGLVVPDVVIRQPAVVSKTWPGYYDMLAAL